VEKNRSLLRGFLVTATRADQSVQFIWQTDWPVTAKIDGCRCWDGREL